MSKRYDPTNWENRIVDGDEVLQPGTPLTAENMNKLEQQVAQLSNERGEPNGTAILDANGIVPARHLPSQLREMRVVGTIPQRDALERFEGLRVLVTDATDDETVEIGWAEYVYNGTKYVKVGEGESLDMAINWDAIVDKPAGLLDKYTQAQVDALLLSKSDADHTHTEFASITQLVNKVQVLEQANEQSSHGHSNKSTLDTLTYSGAKTTIDLIEIEEMKTHTHKWSEIQEKPEIPVKATVEDVLTGVDDTKFVTPAQTKQLFESAVATQQIQIEKFEEPGTHIWTVPNNVDLVYVTLIGAGGGGGGGGGGNASTGGGTAGKAGTDGGITNFGNYISCNGGGGGKGGNSSTTTAYGGAAGSAGIVTTETMFQTAGKSGVQGKLSQSSNTTILTGGSAISSYGSKGGAGGNGGGGTKLAGASGGSGGTGAFIGDYPISVIPGEIITIEIGQGGIGGAAGTNGWTATLPTAGENGSDGKILIKYYL